MKGITGRSSPTCRWLIRVMLPSATELPPIFLLLPAISLNSSVYSYILGREESKNKTKMNVSLFKESMQHAQIRIIT